MSTEPAAGARHDESGRVTAGSASTDVVPFGQALRAWFVISLQTFGGLCILLCTFSPTILPTSEQWSEMLRISKLARYLRGHLYF